MKKILAISNSFGVDANRYFYGISRAGGEDVKVVTLYIGSCSLYRHYRNMLSEEPAYDLYVCGINTGFKVSLKEALLSDEWDIVTLQQYSVKSGEFSSYEPYLSELSAYVKKLAPEAKQYIHAIWAWTDKMIETAKTPIKYNSASEMFKADKEAYKMAAEKIKADGFIPCTAAMEKLYAALGDSAYRDGRHANFGSARYMLGLVWYMTIFNKGIDGLVYRDFDVSVSEEELAIAESCAKEAVAENDYKI